MVTVGIMHLTYRDSEPHTSAVLPASAGEAGAPEKPSSTSLRGKAVHQELSQGDGDVVGVIVGKNFDGSSYRRVLRWPDRNDVEAVTIEAGKLEIGGVGVKPETLEEK
jgi:hypothetical protein